MTQAFKGSENGERRKRMVEDNSGPAVQALDADEAPRCWTRTAPSVGASSDGPLNEDRVAPKASVPSAGLSETPSDPTRSSLAHGSRLPAVRRFPWIALAIAGAMGVLFAVGQFSILPEVIRLFGTPTRVELGVKQHPDGSLLVQWNRTFVERAVRGVLVIEDGPAQHTFHLDRRQLASGTLSYSPAARELTFRLELLTRDGEWKWASIRVVDGSVAPPRAEPTKLTKFRPTTEALPIQNPRHAGLKATPTGRNALAPPSRWVAPRHVAATPSSSGEGPTRIENVPQTLLANSSGFSRARTDSAENRSQPESEPAYVPARALKQVAPSQPNLVGVKLSESVEVAVSVRIDQEGRVTEARIVDSSSNDEQALASAALLAAMQWTFAPARVHGTTVPSNHRIVFQFRPQMQPK